MDFGVIGLQKKITTYKYRKPQEFMKYHSSFVLSRATVLAYFLNTLLAIGDVFSLSE